MDLSTKCLNPVEMNMMDKSDIKLEIKTNENNVMYMCPVDNNTNDTEEPARQSYLSNKNKVKQNQQNTEAEQKINGYGVNLTNRDSVTQEEIDDYGEKCNDQKEIKPVPQFSDETQSSHTEKGKLSNILINTTKKMKKLTGKIKIVKGCVKAKENKKKLTARTGSKILSERNKRISSNSVTPKWTVKTGHENQKGHKNLSDDNNVLKKSIREFTCEQCNKTFSSQYNLNRHYKSVHLKMKQKRKGTKKYFCKQEGCDKVFSNGSNYKKHYDTVHLNIRRHLCEICSFMFKTKWALKTHLNTLHEKDQQKFRIFECKLCQKRFTSKGKLKLHETVHTDLKPFKCSYEDCGKSFRLKHNLTKHINVHLCIKPYVCPICDQAFSRKIYLETHQYKHTGEKKYKCTVCEKRFTQQGNLNVHMKSHRNLEVDFNPLPNIINPSANIINPSPNFINPYQVL